MQAGTHGVFLPHHIVTQTEGMNIWLRQQIAHRYGIAANLGFLKPNDFVFKVYQWLGGGYSASLSQEDLIWLLYQLMDGRAFKARFPKQAEYFNIEGPDKDLRRMGLAVKVADLFDQYQIFRPEMIEAWNRIERPEEAPDWQAYLWVEAQGATRLSLPDKTIVKRFILQQLRSPEGQNAIRADLPTLYLFGLSIITRYHVEILARLAEVTDVRFYLLNPAPHIYWQDDRNEKDLALEKLWAPSRMGIDIAGNALLTSWGKVVQNTYRLLFRNEELLNHYEVVDTREPKGVTLLEKVQRDLYNNATDDRGLITATDLEDGSLSVHVHYTMAREVEGLYHYLVHLIDQRKAGLSPRDIVVMVPDIDAYAPFIKAVFDNAAYSFRFQIADSSLAQGDNIFAALQQFLALREERLTSEAVLQMLDSEWVRNRFRIYDVDKVRQWVSSANIRFGIKGDKEDESALVGWKEGLKRIMFGICLYGEEEANTPDGPCYPLDTIEGSDAWTAIRFVHFVDVLVHHIQARKRKRTIADWAKYIEDAVHDLIFVPEEEVQADYAGLMKKLAGYRRPEAVIEERVSYDVFCQHLLDMLAADTRSSFFMNDGITFCSLIPMRSIPFRVVAMLGMDFESFPRKERPLEFNHIHNKPQLGDRNIKDNDKHLFLETLLSARSYLYLSYIGKSVMDNSVRPASVLIDELMDYVRSGLGDKSLEVEKALVTRHALHGFSPVYNAGDARLYRYRLHADGKKQEFFHQGPPYRADAPEEVTLADIVRFYQHSIKSYYNKVLGVYYRQDEVLVPETEIFALDALEKWRLKNELLGLGKDVGEEALRERWAHKGLLPLHNAGRWEMEKLLAELEPMQKVVRSHTGLVEAEAYTFDLEIGGRKILAHLPQVYQGKYLQVRISGNIVKHMVEAYLSMLAGIAGGHVRQGLLIYGQGEEIGEYPAFVGDMDREEALRRLGALMDMYDKGMESLCVFGDFVYADARLWEMADGGIRAWWAKKKAGGKDAFIDPYLWSADRNGLFSKPGSDQRFNDLAQKALMPLRDVFPTYEF